MKMASTFAIALSLTVGGALLSGPAVAQKKGKQAAAPAQPAAWAPKLSKPEATALQAVETAVAAKDWAAATAALAAAQPVATSPDARYFVGRFQFAIGSGTNNVELQAQGLDAMVASGGGDPTKMGPVYRSQGVLALQAKDYAKAEAAYARWAQLMPNDPGVALATAEVKLRQNKPQEALSLFQRAISAQETAGQAVPENIYLAALQSAVNAKMGQEALTLSKTIVSRFPNPKNWRNALLIYRQNGNVEPTALLDTLRLMRSAKAMDASGEYLQLADLLARGRFYVEARSVVEEGYASGKLSRTNADAAAILKEVGGRLNGDRAALGGLESRARTEAKGEFALRIAEGFFGHGDYAKAAELYRVALQKGGVDSGLVNSRLGIALAMAGQRAEAEAAFKAVTGPRTALASYWLLWLSQRA
jgi:tetratricopeptide (TPR) repeat protein